MFKLRTGMTFIAALGLTGCGLVDTHDDTTLQSVTRLTRSDTGATTMAAVQTSITPSAVENCPPGFQCLTPDNLEGRVYSGSLMVGGNGSSVGYAVTTVGATEDVRRRPDLGKDGTLTFNLNSTTDFSGDYTCCGGSAYPADEDAIVRRLEFAFDFLDATFTVPGTAGPSIAGKTYTIRLVYVVETEVAGIAGDSSVSVMLGDKLVRVPGNSAFRWCDDSACSLASRPASPLAAAGLAVDSGMGNQNYAGFSTNLTDNTSITFTEAEALQGNWTFTVLFDLEDALRFDITGWSAVDSVQDLVAAFSPFGHHINNSTSVRVSLTKAPM